MADVIALIRLVPDVIWSGVIAAFIALAGVVLSNMGNNKRLSTQLTHDASEKRKEKISDLRREIYLQVADEVSLAINYISAFAHGNMEGVDIRSDLKGMTIALARLQLVAEAETAKIASTLVSSYFLFMMRIFQQTLPLQALREDIKFIGEQCVEVDAEISRLLKKITEFNEGASDDKLVIEELKARHKKCSDALDKYTMKQSEAHEEYREKADELNELLLPDIYEISKIQLRLIVAVRGELGVSTDTSELKRQLEHQWSVMKAGYKDAIGSSNEN